MDLHVSTSANYVFTLYWLDAKYINRSAKNKKNKTLNKKKIKTAAEQPTHIFIYMHFSNTSG